MKMLTGNECCLLFVAAIYNFFNIAMVTIIGFSFLTTFISLFTSFEYYFIRYYVWFSIFYLLCLEITRSDMTVYGTIISRTIINASFHCEYIDLVFIHYIVVAQHSSIMICLRTLQPPVITR